MNPAPLKADFQALLAALPQPAQGAYPHGTPFVAALAHGSLRVELFAPATSQLGRDIQQPHAQDELYVVQRGTSAFWRAGQSETAQAGDILFVPAGVEHRFENFSPDFVTWVVFYGPPHGETA
ncbi:cupin domain-containing protein [Hydrogenophaga sp.]|uniref:cupin domain-containing protein n=1 Tax=Hydrogenophaga sp. TaxID=1904254 RepID=UPI00286DFBFD|nr:cupin domain-containing protein [Hydrogenophaga sp.]